MDEVDDDDIMVILHLLNHTNIDSTSVINISSDEEQDLVHNSMSFAESAFTTALRDVVVVNSTTLSINDISEETIGSNTKCSSSDLKIDDHETEKVQLNNCTGINFSKSSAGTVPRTNIVSRTIPETYFTHTSTSCSNSNSNPDGYHNSTRELSLCHRSSSSSSNNNNNNSWRDRHSPPPWTRTHCAGTTVVVTPSPQVHHHERYSHYDNNNDENSPVRSCSSTHFHTTNERSLVPPTPRGGMNTESEADNDAQQYRRNCTRTSSGSNCTSSLRNSYCHPQLPVLLPREPTLPHTTTTPTPQVMYSPSSRSRSRSSSGGSSSSSTNYFYHDQHFKMQSSPPEGSYKGTYRQPIRREFFRKKDYVNEQEQEQEDLLLLHVDDNRNHVQLSSSHLYQQKQFSSFDNDNNNNVIIAQQREQNQKKYNVSQLETDEMYARMLQEQYENQNNDTSTSDTDKLNHTPFEQQHNDYKSSSFLSDETTSNMIKNESKENGVRTDHNKNKIDYNKDVSDSTQHSYPSIMKHSRNHTTTTTTKTNSTILQEQQQQQQRRWMEAHEIATHYIQKEKNDIKRMEHDDYQYAKKLQWSFEQEQQEQQHDNNDNDTEIHSSSFQYGATSSSSSVAATKTTTITTTITTTKDTQQQYVPPTMIYTKPRVHRISQVTQDQINKDAEIALRLQLQYEAENENETHVYQVESEKETTHVFTTI